VQLCAGGRRAGGRVVRVGAGGSRGAPGAPGARQGLGNSGPLLRAGWAAGDGGGRGRASSLLPTSLVCGREHSAARRSSGTRLRPGPRRLRPGGSAAGHTPGPATRRSWRCIEPGGPPARALSPRRQPCGTQASGGSIAGEHAVCGSRAEPKRGPCGGAAQSQREEVPCCVRAAAGINDSRLEPLGCRCHKLGGLLNGRVGLFVLLLRLRLPAGLRPWEEVEELGDALACLGRRRCLVLKVRLCPVGQVARGSRAVERRLRLERCAAEWPPSAGAAQRPSDRRWGGQAESQATGRTCASSRHSSTPQLSWPNCSCSAAPSCAGVGGQARGLGGLDPQARCASRLFAWSPRPRPAAPHLCQQVAVHQLVPGAIPVVHRLQRLLRLVVAPGIDVLTKLVQNLSGSGKCACSSWVDLFL
jgi:hypothetical protein